MLKLKHKININYDVYLFFNNHPFLMPFQNNAFINKASI